VSTQTDSDRKVGSIHILKQMFGYIWPKDRPDIKKRVIFSMALLIIAKVSLFSFSIIWKALTSDGPHFQQFNNTL
jgi:hypothetical protein